MYTEENNQDLRHKPYVHAGPSNFVMPFTYWIQANQTADPHYNTTAVPPQYSGHVYPYGHHHLGYGQVGHHPHTEVPYMTQPHGFPYQAY